MGGQGFFVLRSWPRRLQQRQGGWAWGATWGSQVLKGDVAPPGHALAVPPAPSTRRQALDVAF